MTYAQNHEEFLVLRFLRNSSDGGKIGAEAGVKLAYKTVSAPIFTSDGHPMLLDWLFRSRR